MFNKFIVFYKSDNGCPLTDFTQTMKFYKLNEDLRKPKRNHLWRLNQNDKTHSYPLRGDTNTWPDSHETDADTFRQEVHVMYRTTRSYDWLGWIQSPVWFP